MILWPSRRLILRHAVVFSCVVLLCLLLDRREVVFFSRVGFVAWYPAIGLVVALTVGMSPWYALVACFSLALAGKISYGQPLISFSGIVDAAGSAFCYGIAAYVLRGPLQLDLGLRRRRDVVLYVIVGTLAVGGATIIGVACLIADHGISWTEYRAAAIAWFLGDAIGLVGIAPFLLVHVMPHVRRWIPPEPSSQPAVARSNKKHFTAGALAEACGQALAIGTVCWAMFGLDDGRYGHFYMSFIPIIWIGMRHGVRRAVTGLLALNFGIVAALHLIPPTAEVFTKVGLFMLVISATGLLVGSEVSERHRLARDLNEQTTYLRSLIRSSPFGIVVLDRSGAVEVTNPAFDRLVCSLGENPASCDPARTLQQESALKDFFDMIPDVLAGQSLQKTVRYKRPDGGFLDLAIHGVPLTIETAVRGAYVIYQDISEQVQASQNERRHSESLCQLVSQLQLRAHEMTLLNEMRSLLECCVNRTEARRVIARSIPKILPHACYGSLNYLDPATPGLATLTTRWGDNREVDPSFAIESCWALRRGQPHWSETSDVDVRCSHLKPGSKSNFLCVPISSGSVVGGLMHLEFEPDVDLAAPTGANETLRETLQRLAVSIGGQAATALSALRLREKLEEQSIRDPLTELFNRRFLDESLEREVLRAGRNGRPLSIMLVDIDHFKRFNDTFGHDAGDRVLQSIANLFRTFFRASDICCRYGGEEFAIIMPDSSLQNAMVRASALRTEVKRLKSTSCNGQQSDSITLSIGVAAYPEHGLTAQTLLKAADLCLYDSKANGRDTVTSPSLKATPVAALQS